MKGFGPFTEVKFFGIVFALLRGLAKEQQNYFEYVALNKKIFAVIIFFKHIIEIVIFNIYILCPFLSFYCECRLGKNVKTKEQYRN